jgi:hypothetical protein
MFATAQPETAYATAEKQYGLGNQQPSRFHVLLSTGMMMRKVQRLAERRRAKRPEMRGLYVPAARPLALRFAEKVKPHKSGCHHWTGSIMPNGYGQIHSNGRTAYAHRVAWELANGPIPAGAFVLHNCDNRRCVNPAHMRLGSFQDNMDDMTGRLRHAHGARNAHAKLTVKEVKAIRAMRGTQESVGAKFGVTGSLVSMIRTRRIWKYV